MSETIEYPYKYKTFLWVFFAIIFGFGAYSYAQEALLHPNALAWLKVISSAVVFAFCALNLFFMPLSDKMLRLTETELQIPLGWIIKKTCKIPFDEVEQIALTQGSKSRYLTILRRKKRILVGEEKLPNADAFDRVSKILFEETKKYIGQTTIPLPTEKESRAWKRKRDFNMSFRILTVVYLFLSIPFTGIEARYGMKTPIIIFVNFIVAGELGLITAWLLGKKTRQNKQE